MEVERPGSAPTAPHPNRADLPALASLFLRLGATSFGGPAAHIAMMEHEVVRRRGWLSTAEFLDLLGATNLIPGPNSTELAIHIGWQRARWAGLIVAGACFIAPAALIVLACAAAYVRYGTTPEATALLAGVKPVILAIVAQALLRLGRTALGRPLTLGVALASAGLLIAGGHELLVLVGAGGLGMAATALARRPPGTTATGVACLAGALAARPDRPALGAVVGAGASVAALTTAVPFGLWPLFGFFLKVGSVLFGSGYVLLAYLRADLVVRWGWLTDRQLLDAIAVGQVTPGPVVTTATFIGYVLGGLPGAGLATLGIFLPAFAFVALSGPLVPRLRRSRLAGGFLDGVNAASLALMAVVLVELARSTLIDPLAIGLAIGSGLLLLWSPRLNSAWLIGAGALVGLARPLLFPG